MAAALDQYGLRCLWIECYLGVRLPEWRERLVCCVWQPQRRDGGDRGRAAIALNWRCLGLVTKT